MVKFSESIAFEYVVSSNAGKEDSVPAVLVLNTMLPLKMSPLAIEVMESGGLKLLTELIDPEKAQVTSAA
ncbi:MAG: hypothetical protein B6D72_09415 [gamma proteobacterium symbiont of Ctena orbiculata]|nr:MAG: hypothetical protein B6D72_09415 [gamma proteobacterium symbiont of Ctena orbiculata]PVV12198.1 MAG: hypothetical protein B6D82_10125 [gamma proteobacterium symbiont of Ctena orbiculata]